MTTGTDTTGKAGPAEHGGTAGAANLPPHISRTSRKDIESVLADALGARFGGKFAAYRTDYHKVLDSDRSGFLPPMPITVGLELLNKCNFKCVMCLTPKLNDPKVVISDATIAKILDECRSLSVPALMFGMGEEPLLHKGFLEVLNKAEAAGIMDIFLFTNGLLLNERIAEALVRAGTPRVFISIDAATPETFLKIRGSRDLEKIEENVKRLVVIRDRAGSALPIVRVSFCVQPANKAERAAFIEKWENVVDHVDIQEMHDFSRVQEMGALSEAERFEAGAVADPELRCHQPWEKLTIWSNGDVSPCCTFHGKNLIVGSVHRQTVGEIWNGEKIGEVRRQLANGTLNPVCRVCLENRDAESFEDRS
jgi:radical SAM protein with 4Fe4S-binding SPASM domain